MCITQTPKRLRSMCINLQKVCCAARHVSALGVPVKVDW